MELPFKYHRNGYLMADDTYKKRLCCNDIVKIYYEDGTETVTSYLGYISAHGVRYDSFTYITLPFYRVGLRRIDCCYYQNTWVDAFSLCMHIHSYIEFRKPKQERTYMVEIENSDQIDTPMFDLSGIDLSKKPRYSYNGIEIALYQHGNLLDTMKRLDSKLENMITDYTKWNDYEEDYTTYFLYDSSENYIGECQYEYFIRTKVLDCNIRFEYENGDEILEELNRKKYDYYLDMHLKPKPTKEYTIEDAYNRFRDMVIRDQQRD